MSVGQPSRAPPTSIEGQVNVLIMNLPFRARWQDLKDLCRQACQVERADVALEIDGRSRGFGEVTCSSKLDADKLYQMYDGLEWQGRKLSVIVLDSNTAQQQQSISSSGETSSRAIEFRPPAGLMQSPMAADDKMLFIGNLPFSMQWQDLKDLLRPAGRIQRADISLSHEGRSRGWGTAVFTTAEEAQKAVEMFNDTVVDGRTIKVRLDRLGGRGIPAGPARPTYPILQHPGSYPLQQNYASQSFNPEYSYPNTRTDQQPATERDRYYQQANLWRQ